MAHKFNPANMGRLEGGERRRSLNPEAILSRIGLKPGDTFLDLGCGPGFFSLPAARTVGVAGRVLAVDVERAMVERVLERARQEGLAQIQGVVSEESHVALPDGIADRGLISNVLHEAEDPGRFLSEAQRLLKPGGRLAVVEWQKEQTEHGPPLAIRLAPATVREWLERVGLRFVEEFAAGPHHYGVVAERHG